jgi:hypothetical protein
MLSKYYELLLALPPVKSGDFVEGLRLELRTRSFQHAFEVTLFYTNILLWNIEQSVIFIYTALPTELSLHKIKDIIE